MVEDIKNLIEKIQRDGIKTAEEKAGEIEARARQEAERIIKEAEVKSNALAAEAKEKIARMEEKQKTLLSQAGRDMVLVLRKEITAILDRVIMRESREILKPEALGRIISGLIKTAVDRDKIVISLNSEDLEALQRHFSYELGEELKKGITLRAAQDIGGGFTISYNGGKSQWDFTDRALAEYIGGALKPKLEQILKDSVVQKK